MVTAMEHNSVRIVNPADATVNKLRSKSRFPLRPKRIKLLPKECLP